MTKITELYVTNPVTTLDGTELFEIVDNAGASGGVTSEVLRSGLQPSNAKLTAAAALDGDIVGDDDTQTLTNKTIIFSDNTITNPLWFRARLSANHTPSSTQAIIPFDTEMSDPSSIFDTTTYKCTPNKAGKWLVVAHVSMSVGSLNNNYVRIFKNSGSTATGANAIAAGYVGTIEVTDILDMNGTTDTFEVRCQAFATTPTVLGASTADTYFMALYLGA